jgi:hypothetical protein
VGDATYSGPACRSKPFAQKKLAPITGVSLHPLSDIRRWPAQTD